MHTQQLQTKWKDLKFLVDISEEYLEANVDVIIQFPDIEPYDTEADPDRVMRTDEDEKAYHKASRNFENGNYTTFEELKKKHGYV